jgi:hypothetical protein
MALLVGAAYWLIHGNVEWLWQVPGATIPAVLMVAAALASVDARAGVLWPRTSRWLLWKRSTDEAGSEPGQTGARLAPFSRRPLSRAFRIGSIVVSVVVVALAGLTFLSLEIQRSAATLSRTEPLRAAARSGSAQWVTPGDAGPFVAQASIYYAAARATLATPLPDRAGAILDDLALAAVAYEKAVAKEPADWKNHYGAAWAALDLLLARGYTGDSGTNAQGAHGQPRDLLGSVAGEHDWSSLSGAGPAPPAGLASGSLAQGEGVVRAAQKYRNMTASELAAAAWGFIRAADERNPLEPAIDETIELLGTLSTD